METEGFWYKNKKLFEITTRKHIDMIISKPELFGLTSEYVNSIFKKHNEKVNFEGKARVELIKEVIDQSWIRVRHYVRPKDFWSIQYNNYTQQKKALKDLIEALVFDIEKMNINDEVVFTGLGDNSRYEYTFMTGGIKTFLQEKVTDKKRKIKITLFEDWNKLQEKDTQEILTESNLSRLLSHMDKYDCGTISAFKGIFSKKENIQRHKKLTAILLDKGYSLTEIDGSYIENFKTPEAVEVKELSLFVSDMNKKGNLKSFLMSLGEYFNQDSILFIPKSGKTAYLIGTSSEAEFPGYRNEIQFSTRKLGTPAEFMSKIRNRPMVYEKLNLRRIHMPEGFHGKWATHAIAEQDCIGTKPITF